MAITFEKRLRIYERDGFKCVGCGMEISKKQTIETFEQAALKNGRIPKSEVLTLDHVLPRAYGGSDNDSNLQTMCAPCNREKGCKVPEPELLTKRHLRTVRRAKAKPKPHDKPRLRLGVPQTFATIGIRVHHRDCHPIHGCSMHCPVDGAMGRCVA